MSLIFNNGVLLFRDTGAGPLLAKDEACCCCTCDTLPDTLYGILSRDAGDWSACAAGKWDDGEKIVFTKMAGTSGSTCEGDEYISFAWRGTLACGDTIELCCDYTVSGTDLTVTMWWCDPAHETQGVVSCEGGQFALTAGDMVIDDLCCCDENVNPVTFTITFYLDDPSP